MYKIGQIAKLTGVSVDTIRYYEKQGLMECRERTHAGYRIYNKEDLKRLRFIRYAKQLGFTLDAVAELLSIRVARQEHTCRESKEIVDRRLKEVREKLVELQTMYNSLKNLSELCCGSTHSTTECTILEVLEQQNLQLK